MSLSHFIQTFTLTTFSLTTARFTQHDSATIVTFEDSFFVIEPVISFGRQIRQTEGSGFDPDNPCSEVECVYPPVCTNTIISNEINAQCGIFDETTSQYNCNYGYTHTLLKYILVLVPRTFVLVCTFVPDKSVKYNQVQIY